jgi:Uma2 family endonuclease
MTVAIPSRLKSQSANLVGLEGLPRRLTLAEFWDYDDGTDTQYELEDGVLIAMPTESPGNNSIAKWLLFELAQWVPIALLSNKTEIEVPGRRASCRMPDLLVHTEDSQAAVLGTKRDVIRFEMPPPAIVIEVVSPGTENRNRDYRYKRTEYAGRGILEYWIIDPEERQVTLCQWVDGQYEDLVLRGDDRLVSTVLPEFALTVDQILRFGE